ncbi:MAG TPA: D-alanyl-D-alanine carboxypeptidase [Streptosporangiaceae bacterium]|nr:D-alanyl-D-alanine carboxypeptidase [Streptosporangiaceae bacterium]
MRTFWRSAAAVAAAATAAVALAAGCPAAAGSAGPAGKPGRTAHRAVTAVGGARGTVGGAELTRPGVIVNYPSPRAPRVPKIPAGAFVVADATTGQVLAAMKPHALYGPASTLKILTAVSLIPVLNPDATVVASKRAVSVEPDVVGLKLGYRYKIADLFRALLLISGNDAAIALAEATGSLDKGIALMNAEAHHLQAYDTVARQPNGLDASGQHVSAYDEALIARRALQIPAFLGYDRTPSAWFPITPKQRIELFNEDRLLTTYRGFIGGKTGWTTPAMATYVGTARRQGHTLIVTLLHAVPGTLFTSATAMLNWGFRLDGKIRPVGQLVSPLPSPVAHRAAPARPAPAARRAATQVHASSSGGILMLFIVGGIVAGGLAVGAHGLARRRRSAP